MPVNIYHTNDDKKDLEKILNDSSADKEIKRYG